MLLAGGLSRRMGGGDKCLRLLGGRSILERVIERVRPQATRLLINANGDPARFGEFGLPVAADAVEGFVGPLAGVLTGMLWARAHAPDIADIVTVPTDGPFVPRDLIARFVAARDQAGADLVQAASGGQVHPVAGLWPVRLAEDLRRTLVDEGIRKVDVWTARHRLVTVEFATAPVDPFFNANRPEDLAVAERLLEVAE
ncbi:MAG: molybdenum cofactor guanylyltransferase MobA [Proteobacteria bacterium]|nr:molybdenum cofactor guanylyltransferase MobA [Pseudomonadota bacterium]